MKRYRQLLSLLMAIVMVIGMIPMYALANGASVEVGGAVVAPEAGGSGSSTEEKDFSDAVALPLGEKQEFCYSDEFINAGSWGNFSYTPSKSAWYRIAFESVEPILMVDAYNSDGVKLGQARGTCAASFDYYIHAGETYYFSVCLLSFYEFTGEVTELAPSTEMHLDETAISGNPGDTHWLVFSFDGIPESVNWSSSAPDVADVAAGDERSGGVAFYNEGTAIITATSENGLTASCEVTVNAAPALELDTPKQVVLEDGSSMTLTFTPDESGFYNFLTDFSAYGEETDDIHLFVRENELEDMVDDWNQIYCVELTAGTTYKVLVHADYYRSATFDLLVEKCPTAKRMILNPYSQTMYVGAKGSVYAVFEPEGSMPQDVTFQSDNPDVVSVDEEGNLTALSTGTAAISAWSDPFGATAYVTVYDVKMLSKDETVTETVTSVSSGGDLMVYCFVAPEDGTYGVSFESTYSEFNARLLGVNMEQMDSDAGAEFRMDCEMEEGETIFLKTIIDFAPQTYSVGVKKLEKSTSMSIVAETVAAYEDLYSSYKYEVLFDGLAEEVTWSSSDPNVASIDPNGWVKFLSEGGATITATSENGLTASVDVLVYDVPELILDREVDITLTEKEQKRYSFTPEEDGAYLLTGTADDHFGCELYYSEGYVGSVSFGTPRRLEAGITYTVDVYGYDFPEEQYSASFKITKGIDATSIAVSPAELTIYLGESCLLACNFEPEGCAEESVSWEIEDPSVVSNDGWSGEGIWLYGEKVGTTTVTVTSASGLTDSATVTVAERPKVDLYLDTPYTVDAAVDGGKVLFKFVPEVSGHYAFYSFDNDFDTRAYLYDVNMNWLAENDDYEDNNFRISYSLTAGETYYLLAHPYSEQSSGTYKVAVERPAAPQYVTIDQGDAYSGFAGSSCYFSITQGPSGTYWESFSWTSSDPAVVFVDAGGNAEFLSAGTAILTVTTESGLTDSITVTVQSLSDLPLLVLDQSVTVDATIDNGKRLFRFVPEISGTYCFYSSNNDYDVFAALYDSNQDELDSDDDGGDGLNFLITYKLTAGETYLLRTSPNSHQDYGTYEVQVVKAPAATAVEITEGDTYSGYEGTEHTLYVDFEPVNCEQEEYSWSSSDPTVVSVDDWGNISLLNGGTAVVTVTTESGLTDRITVTVKSLAGLPVIRLDETKSISTYMGDEGLFAFTPTESGRYVYYSHSNGGFGEYLSVNGDIYNGWMESIYSDWFDDGYGNFIAYFEAEAGNTYYLESYVSENGKEGAYKVCVSKAKAAESVVICRENEPIDRIIGSVGEEFWVDERFYPERSVGEECTWSVADESVVYFDSGWLQLQSPGTTTLTVTTESGLTDSIIVEVRAAVEMEFDQSYAISMEEDAGKAAFTFTAESDSTYLLESVDQAFGWYYNLFDSNGNYCSANSTSTSNTQWISFFVTAGETYTLRYYCDDPSAAGTNSLRLIDLGKGPYVTTPSGNPLKVSVGESIWPNPHIFFADGSYIVNSLEFKSDNESVVSTQSGNLQTLSAGTANLTVFDASGEYGTLTVNVEPARELSLDVPVAGVGRRNGSELYSFTPEVSAEYSFVIQSDYWTTVGLRLGEDPGNLVWDSKGEGEGALVVTHYLDEGFTYYFEIDTNPGDEFDAFLTKAGAPQTVSFAEGETYEAFVYSEYTFQPIVAPLGALTNAITLTSSDETVAVVAYGNTVNFVGVGTAVLTLTAPNGATDQITVTVKSLAGYTPLTLNTPAEGKGNCGFRFTPEKSGTYYFTSYSKWGEDLYAELRNGQGEWLDQDHDSGYGENFLIGQELTAGETYYLAVSTGHMSPAGYEVAVYQTAVPTGLSITAGDHLVLPSYQSVTLEAIVEPFYAEQESVTFSGSNADALYIYDWGGLDARYSGTSVVTATSESGFTDSITVDIVSDDVYDLTPDHAVTTMAWGGEDAPILFRFTPEEAGNYEIVLEGRFASKVTVLNAYGDVAAEGIGSALVFPMVLKAGEPCFINAMQADDIENYFYTVSVRESLSADWDYTVNGDYVSITGYNGDGEDLQIPAKIEGLPVTTVNSAVFQNNKTLKSVTFPEGFTTVGSFAFSGCKNLAKVVLPTTLTTVGRYAFANCGITDVYFDDTAEAWTKVTVNTGNDPLTNATLHLHVHEFGTYVSNHDGDCFTDTTGTAKCVGCEATDTKVIRVAPGKHTESDPVVEQEPDCSNSGWGWTYCTACGDTVKSYVELPALGNHTESDPVVEQEPDCGVSGWAWTYCTVCGTTMDSYIELPATGDHTESEVIVEVEPDCGNDGWGYTECTVCGELMTERVTLKATGKHTAGELVITKEPTCSEAGSGYFPCTVCGGIAVENATLVPTNNHIEGDLIVDVEPTATEAGSGHTECTVCGTPIQTNVEIPALGVTVNWTYTIKNSAVTITGYEGNAEDLEIPALLEGYPVTVIQSGVFQNETALKSVRFPVTLTTIGSFAFSGCTALTEIDLPENVSAVGRYAFANCKNLRSITVRNPYLTFGANAYPATTEIIYAYAMDVSKPHFTVDASNINLAVLHTAGLKATRLYWGYAGTEKIETQDWNTFTAAVPSAIRVNDYNPTEGEVYAMEKSGYYLFWVSYVDENGATKNICHTVYAGGALDENYGKPYLEFDKTGRVAWMNLNGTKVQKMYWGFIGDTDYKYQTWDEFCTRVRANGSYLPDYGVKDGEGYVVNEVGYYRFVIVYLDAQGIRQERYFTIKAETPATAPSIDNSALSTSGILVNEEQYSAKVYYGYIGDTDTKYVDFNTFKATAESFTTVFGPKPGTAFKMDKAGYWRFVINYNVNGATKDAICTVYVDEADLALGTPKLTQSGTAVTLDHNGATVTKMYIGYMGTDPVEVDSWADYTALRKSNTTYYGPKDGTTTDLGKNSGYYTVVVTYNTGGADQLAFFTFYLK